MYSLVMMAAMASGPDSPSFHGRLAAFFHGSGCYGPVVYSQGCYGSGYSGCTGCSGGCYGGGLGYGLPRRFHRSFGYASCYGSSCYGCSCVGSCVGSTIDYGDLGGEVIYSGGSCYGSSCYGSSCYGSSCYGSSCYGSSCYGSSCYGSGGFVPMFESAPVMSADFGFPGISTGCTGYIIGRAAPVSNFTPSIPSVPMVAAASPTPAPVATAPAKAPQIIASTEMSNEKPSLIRVDLPTGAKLSVDGVAVEGTGSSRSFSTPALPTDKPFYYEMQAEMVVDGAPVSEKLTVVVRGGETVVKSFGKLIAAAERQDRTRLVKK